MEVAYNKTSAFVASIATSLTRLRNVSSRSTSASSGLTSRAIRSSDGTAPAAATNRSPTPAGRRTKERTKSESLSKCISSDNTGFSNAMSKINIVSGSRRGADSVGSAVAVASSASRASRVAARTSTSAFPCATTALYAASTARASIAVAGEPRVPNERSKTAALPNNHPKSCSSGKLSAQMQHCAGVKAEPARCASIDECAFSSNNATVWNAPHATLVTCGLGFSTASSPTAPKPLECSTIGTSLSIASPSPS
mmetsp:Transcript_3402/g.9347  ORF Transcript_3402/g.9347 Transcript_3402/m.9347 type:complete len:254 (+) Transcript_3402:1143-1904(+)